MRKPYRIGWLGLLLFIAPPAAAGVPAGRQDAARSYLAFERAMLEHPPAAGSEHRDVARRFDRLTRLTFRGDWDRAVVELDELSDALRPGVTAAGRAARATAARAEPPVAVRGHDEAVMLSLAPLYDVPGRPERLRVRLTDGDRVEAEADFDAAGDSVRLPVADLPPGRYAVEVGGGGRFFDRGAVSVLADSPADLRRALAARLDAADVPERLRRSLAAARSRLALLKDAPAADATTPLVIDLAQLAAGLPGEVGSLLAGDDPYAGRNGDYWRTFGGGADGSLVPARVFAPADAVASGKSLPLVIALHGAGGDEHLFMEGYGAGLLKKLAAERGFLLVSAQTYAAGTDPRALPALVGAMGELYDLDPDRVYAVGHSLGAIASAAWAFRDGGDQVAGVALLAGGGQVGPTAAGRGVATFVAAAELDRIFRPDRLAALADAAQAAGAPAAFRLYPDESHVSIVPASLPDAVDWLLDQRRGNDAGGQ